MLTSCGWRADLKVNQDRPDAKLPYRGAWLMIGPEMIHLMELPNPDPLTDRPEHGGRDRHVCIAVESGGVVALQDRLTAAGATSTRCLLAVYGTVLARASPLHPLPQRVRLNCPSRAPSRLVSSCDAVCCAQRLCSAPSGPLPSCCMQTLCTLTTRLWTMRAQARYCTLHT